MDRDDMEEGASIVPCCSFANTTEALVFVRCTLSHVQVLAFPY
jgi:hypothetical protein